MTQPWISVSSLDNPADPNAEEAVHAASFILYQLSGQKYGGVHTTTEQYVCHTTGAPTGCTYDIGRRAWWNPVLGLYTVVLGPMDASLWGRSRLAEGTHLRLRGYPVRSISSVTLGPSGTVVAASAYELLDRRILAPKTDLAAPWNLCDDKAPVVTYTYGVAPPAAGKIACRKLANELVQLRSDPTACDLPDSVRSISRQGISFDMFDPQEFLDKGRTGVYEIDLFLASVNPGKATKKSRVFTPDNPRVWRRP